MIAVTFEVFPKEGNGEKYLEQAASLRELLVDVEGLISIERFQSFSDESKVLSLSFWEDESSLEKWRNQLEHRMAQAQGKDKLFSSYRIRVCRVERDYTENDRQQAPEDSVAYHG